MRDNSELLDLVEKHLESGLDNLWDSLAPEERRIVFLGLIVEYIGVNY